MGTETAIAYGSSEASIISVRPATDAGKALYHGCLVVVTCRRPVAGGIACDVRRARPEGPWPWTVQEFTVPESELLAS